MRVTDTTTANAAGGKTSDYPARGGPTGSPASMAQQAAPTSPAAQTSKDPAIGEIAGGLGSVDTGSIMSELRTQTRSALESGAAAQPCAGDVARLCASSPADRSQPLHCLARNQAQLTRACRGSIEKSVPFQCAIEMTQFSCDGVVTPVLSCLIGNIGRVSQDCADTIRGTREESH